MRHLHALLSHGIGIDGVVEEKPIDGVSQGRYDHQGYNERVAIGDFGDEEDARQRGVKHACHQTAHANKGELRWIQVTDTQIIDKCGKEQTRESPNKQGRGKGATHTARTKGKGRGKSLQQYHACKEDDN